MTEQTDNTAGSGWRDTALLVLAVLLLLAGIAAFYWFGAQPTWLRVVAVLVGAAAAAGAVWLSATGRSAWQFVQGSRVELRKMVWPTVPETRNTTLIVVVFVIVLGIFFWLVDLFLSWGTQHLLSRG